MKIKLGIVGLGLIGASILKKLYNNEDYEIYCHSNSSYNEAKNYTPFASNDIKIVQNCDIVFLCCELSKTLHYLDKLNTFLNQNTTVVDVASVKENKYPKYNFNFILSHPMAGVENSGFSAGDENLFSNSKWLIEKENEILNKVILDLEAKILKVDMEKHNFLTAQISHLPAILSSVLFDCATNEAKQIASSGFRDTTRLAMTNSSLINSMFENNQENILKAFEMLIEKMNLLKNMNKDERINLFNEIASKRAKMYDNNGKNIFKI